MAEGKYIGLNIGGPGGEAINDVTAMLLDATKGVLNEKTDASDIFKYGADGGDEDCIAMVAKFLGQQYGTPVSTDTLILTAGATHGLHFLLTTLMVSSKIVLIEDPAYFFVIPMIRDDLQNTLVPVPRDEDGMIPEMLDELLTSHKPTGWHRTESSRFWASIYFVPTFNNPTGQSYSHARLRQLVSLARKHGVLLIAEDLYQFLSFADDDQTTTTTLSLLETVDRSTDPDYDGGHLVSNSSFSKLIAPGLRLGWIEGPPWLIEKLAHCSVSRSGGSFNQYTSKLVAEIIRTGKDQVKIKKIKRIYKTRMASVIQTLRNNLPEGCSFEEPKGGFYVWLELRRQTDAVEFRKFAMDKYKVGFIPGVWTSPTGGFKNFVRISVAAWDEPDLVDGVKRFCKAYTDYLTRQQ